MSKSVTSEAQRQEMKRQKKESDYRAAIQKLPIFNLIALCVTVAALLLFFVNFAQIYNTDIPGIEVRIDGWACMAAGITGDFMSTASIYKDMAVPFYYYATAWCASLSTLTLIAFIAIALSLVLHIVQIVKPNGAFPIVNAVLGVLAGILLFLGYIKALGMNQSDILPYYCSSNPACSIQSYAMLPAVMMLVAFVFDLICAARYMKARELLK